jgi:hypothetical protein
MAVTVTRCGGGARNSASARDATSGKLGRAAGSRVARRSRRTRVRLTPACHMCRGLAGSRWCEALNRRFHWGTRVLCGTPTTPDGVATSRRGMVARSEREEEEKTRGERTFSWRLSGARVLFIKRAQNGTGDLAPKIAQ